MYPGTIELATKLRYDGLVAEGRREQFMALNCVAPAGVWQPLTGIRRRVGVRLMQAGNLLPRARIAAGKIPGRVATA